MPEPISFFRKDTRFKPSHPRKTISWLKRVSDEFGYEIQTLNFIFCSDDYLLGINQHYLAHDYYTDIITFDNSEGSHKLEGDIFISIDRVRENARNLRVPFQDELDRVMVHGVLHLMGYSDKNPSEKSRMRKKEDACLSLR